MWNVVILPWTYLVRFNYFESDSSIRIRTQNVSIYQDGALKFLLIWKEAFLLILSILITRILTTDMLTFSYPFHKSCSWNECCNTKRIRFLYRSVTETKYENIIDACCMLLSQIQLLCWWDWYQSYYNVIILIHKNNWYSYTIDGYIFTNFCCTLYWFC